MIRHSIGILATALALAAPLTCAAETIEFDRNSNGKPDISFALEIDGVPVGNIVAFDNDEDGMYDFGFQGGCNGAGDGVLCAMWIDKNGDGEVQKKEVRKLHSSLPWATFPSSYVPSSALNGNGGRDYFMDYTDDDYMTAREIGRDLNCDGDIERDVFLAAEDATALPTEELYGNYNLIDRNNDGFFDTFESRDGDGFTVERFDLKKWSRHLPVLTFVGSSCLDSGS